MKHLITALALIASSAGVSADAQAGDDSTVLVTLGTAGGPQPRPHRSQFSNALIVNGVTYIVDAGDGVARRLAKAKIRIPDISTVFITHGHDDHVGGLGPLLMAEWNLQRKTPVVIYGPPGTQEIVSGITTSFHVPSEIKISDGLRSTPIGGLFIGRDVSPGLVYQDTNIKVTAVENNHFHFPEKASGHGKFLSYAYRFETADRVIVFTGDTGPSAPVTALARNADILVSEINSVEDLKEQRIANGTWQAMSDTEQREFIRHQEEEHLSPEEVGKMASAANVKMVVLSHFTATRNPDDDYEKWRRRVQNHFKGPVVAAKDLMRFPQ